MAVKNKKAVKKSKSIEITLWDVVLSYPDLHDPKPFKGKVYYRTDVLIEPKSRNLKKVNEAIETVMIASFGKDKSEWPEMKKLIQNGDEREDSKGYAGKRFITAQTQTPVPVVDLDGNPFKAQMVKGGMFANVAILIKHWEFDGDEGVTIYLQGVQIDTDKPSLNFGGGKSVKQMFNRDSDEGESEDEDSDDSDEDEDMKDEDEEDAPPPRKTKKKPSRDFDEDYR